MLRKIVLEVGHDFESHYPIRTGPAFERVKGEVAAIHLASGMVEIHSHDRTQIWMISIEDAFNKDINTDRVDD